MGPVTSRSNVAIAFPMLSMLTPSSKIRSNCFRYRNPDTVFTSLRVCYPFRWGWQVGLPVLRASLLYHPELSFAEDAVVTTGEFRPPCWPHANTKGSFDARTQA